jgi:phosphatidate phosphatase APP1
MSSRPPRLICYRSYGWRDGNDGAWNVLVCGFASRRKPSRWRRRLITRIVRRNLPSRIDENSQQLMTERVAPFALRGVENKTLAVAIGNDRFDLPVASDGNGYFESRIPVDQQQIELAKESNRQPTTIHFRVFLEQDNNVNAAGEATLIEPTGVSVISDIDDTIKETEMTDRQRLVENTFLREFRAVDGMADLYHRWHRAGVQFHYVSLSPRPLYEPLLRFVESTGFPSGSLHLRRFRFRDQALKRMFSRQSSHKEREIRAILQSFPHRKFVLVGDDADRDPELYSSIAEDYSEQVASIYLRHVSDQSVDEIEKRLGNEARKCAQVFQQASELPGQL